MSQLLFTKKKTYFKILQKEFQLKAQNNTRPINNIQMDILSNYI